MLKDKLKRLFLILVVILFSTINTSCDKKAEETIVENTISASYIHAKHGDFISIVSGEYTLIHNYDELASIITSDIPEKYDENFFESNGLVLFKNEESSGGNTSEITSYSIINDTIIIEVITTNYGQTGDCGEWFYTLELSNERFNRVKNVIIAKNGKQVNGQPIVVKSENEIINEIKETYAIKHNAKSENKITVDEVNVLYYFGRYKTFYVAIVEGDMPSEDEKTLSLGDLTFSFEKETISLYEDKIYYSLSFLYKASLLNNEELKDIYDKYQAIITK